MAKPSNPRNPTGKKHKFGTVWMKLFWLTGMSNVGVNVPAGVRPARNRPGRKALMNCELSNVNAPDCNAGSFRPLFVRMFMLKFTPTRSKKSSATEMKRTQHRMRGGRVLAGLCRDRRLFACGVE